MCVGMRGIIVVVTVLGLALLATDVNGEEKDFFQPAMVPDVATPETRNDPVSAATNVDPYETMTIPQLLHARAAKRKERKQYELAGQLLQGMYTVNKLQGRLLDFDIQDCADMIRITQWFQSKMERDLALSPFVIEMERNVERCLWLEAVERRLEKDQILRDVVRKHLDDLHPP